ncbi:MAG TPA: DUF3619 family protein [Rhodocyclaceae bacterium]|nr:DUF3619 family protein [Rhodocyclaceae bacterium]
MNYPLELQEQQLAALVRRTLDASCRDIPSDIAVRLSQGVDEALQHQKVVTRRLSLAGFGGFSTSDLLRPARIAVSVLAMLAGMMGSYYWNSYQNAEDNIEVDSALLSDELPMDAYTDQGFRTWLEHSASSE